MGGSERASEERGSAARSSTFVASSTWLADSGTTPRGKKVLLSKRTHCIVCYRASLWNGYNSHSQVHLRRCYLYFVQATKIHYNDANVAKDACC